MHLRPSLIGLSACFALGCGEEAQRQPLSLELEALQADYVVYGLETKLTRAGVLEAIVSADTAYSFGDSLIVHLRGNVRLISYDADLGNELAEVTAEWGRLNTSNNALVARGNAVLVIRADERRIESAELRYSPIGHRIWSDSASVMYVDEHIIEGSGFDSDLDFESPTIRNATTRAR